MGLAAPNYFFPMRAHIWDPCAAICPLEDSADNCGHPCLNSEEENTEGEEVGWTSLFLLSNVL